MIRKCTATATITTTVFGYIHGRHSVAAHKWQHTISLKILWGHRQLREVPLSINDINELVNGGILLEVDVCVGYLSDITAQTHQYTDDSKVNT